MQPIDYGRMIKVVVLHTKLIPIVILSPPKRIVKSRELREITFPSMLLPLLGFCVLKSKADCERGLNLPVVSTSALSIN
jgi:hypothetical protein